MTETLAESSECSKSLEDEEDAKQRTDDVVFTKIAAGEDAIFKVESEVENCRFEESDTTSKASCVAANSDERNDASNCSSSCVIDLKTSDASNHSLNTPGVKVVLISDHNNIDLGLSTSKETLTSMTESFSYIEATSSGISSACMGLPQQFDQLSEEDYESIATCRICHSDGEAEPLISPCLCTGTVKHVHHSCLMDWLKRCVKTKCELCLQPISVNRKTKPLKQWRRPGQKPTPIIWLLTFIVALTLNIASIAKDGSQKCVSNPCIIFYVVGAIGALLGFAFFYHFLLVSIRYVKQWMALNEDWTLDELSKTNGLGNANLALSDKSLGAKEQTEVEMIEVV